MSTLRSSTAISLTFHAALAGALILGSAELHNSARETGTAGLAKGEHAWVQVSDLHETSPSHSSRKKAQSVSHTEPGPGSGSETNSNPGAATAYLLGVRSKIQNAVHYPLALRHRGVTGTVDLEVRVTAEGALQSATVQRTSGLTELDQMALQAVRQVAPFGPPPQGEITFMLPIEYRLSKSY